MGRSEVEGVIGTRRVAPRGRFLEPDEIWILVEDLLGEPLSSDLELVLVDLVEDLARPLTNSWMLVALVPGDRSAPR